MKIEQKIKRAHDRITQAAPDLLEALENLVIGVMEYTNDDEAELPDVAEAIEAIRKATGKKLMAA
jgi:hypothetical protein